MTHKRRLAIVDDDGEHIMAVYVEPDAIGYEGADLSGLVAIGIRNLRGTSFRGASLYWANLHASDLSGCNFEDADLCGANLSEALLIGANLRHAKLGPDSLGGSTNLRGADLTDAQLDEADLHKARYDDRTRFPDDFNPRHAGCIHEDAS